MAIFAEMKLIRAEEQRENRVYLIAWMAVFMFLALRIAIECFVRGEGAIDFRGILYSWWQVVPFLVLFLIHNYLIAPLLIYDKNHAAYGALTAALLTAFFFWLFLFRGDPEPGMMPLEPGPMDYVQEGPPPDGRWGRPMHPDVLRGLVAVLLVGVNIGVKMLFYSENERLKLQRLEKENLQHQLESLRYQINPHFFMNTLNNIHALVDLDPEKAKESIVELSKLMRHVLYDTDKATISLDQELDFMDNYMSLMRMRFGDNVEIDSQRPDDTAGAEVPPLAFASFVENAFKHGISYERASFVHISVAVDADKIIFRCKNSSNPQRGASGSGLGIANSRQRFDLLYGEAYTLHIDDKPDVFEVLLVLPAKPARKV